MIEKKIFYVWFGDKKPANVYMCLQNWVDKLKGYEFIEINKDSKYFDFEYEYNNCRWFKEVYDKKLWAFVSDYVRCKVLYEQGGIYLDTDITFVKDIEPLLNCEFFIGKENDKYISAGIFGCTKKHPLLLRVLEFYNNEIYKSPLYTIPEIFTYIIKNETFSDINIYESKYFYPYHYKQDFTPDCITPDTYTIHWWSASWSNFKTKRWLQNKHKGFVERLKDFPKEIFNIKNTLEQGGKKVKYLILFGFTIRLYEVKE